MAVYARCSRCGKQTQRGRATTAHVGMHEREDMEAFVARTDLRRGDVLVYRGHRYTVTTITGRAIGTVPEGSDPATTRRSLSLANLQAWGYRIERPA